MLLMSGLLYAVHWFLYSGVSLAIPNDLKFSFQCSHDALWIVLPLVGWVAESWLGRYRAIVVGLILCLVTILTAQVAFVMLQFDWTPIPALMLIILGMLIGTFGIGSFYTIMLPFALDQMIGASAEQLSAVVHWYCWGLTVGNFFQQKVQCVPIPDKLQYLEILPVIFLTTATLCFSAVLIMDCLYHKRLDTNNKTGNPIKLIFQVLNYARKNKCPRLRSALTYIDEEHPSRIDFGKHKFGGPFTEEEVEDVKTVFYLIPILLSVTGTMLFCEFNLGHVTTTNKIINCVTDINDSAILPFVLIPVYRFIVYPPARKYIPSLLKMIGAGLILCLVSTVIKVLVTTIEQFSEQSHNITIPDTPQLVSQYWILIVEFLNGLGTGVTMMYSFEFVMAQTPNRMRGIMMGLVITLVGWSTLGSYILNEIFHLVKASFLFYFYLVLPLLAMLMLIIFVIVAKRYKLRERERHVNIQAIVEEHYERYFDQEEEYLREAKINYCATNINP